MRVPARPTALLIATILALTACSGDEEPTPTDAGTSGDPESATTSEAAAEPYLEVPDGVELTAPGSSLAVGDTATVAYELPEKGVGVLDVKVTSLERATFDLFSGWDLKQETRKTRPYFVHARVTNVGSTNLGGRPVPLYIVDGENRLIESSIFTGTFKPCDGSSFPKRFPNGKSLKACMVYLAPDKGDLTAVSFRPSQEFNPITWTGELAPAKGTQAKKGKKGKKGDKSRNKKRNGNG